MIPGPKELALRPARKARIKDSRKSMVKYWARIFGPAMEKAARRSVPPKTAKSRLLRNRPGYFPFFAYQSALTDVKLFHFSGRSSSAKMAGTEPNGNHAPRS